MKDEKFSKEEIWAACDKIAAELPAGKRVTGYQLIKHFDNQGSPNRFTRLVKEWEEMRAESAEAIQIEMPSLVEEEVKKAAAIIWAAAEKQVAEVMANTQKELKLQKEAAELVEQQAGEEIEEAVEAIRQEKEANELAQQQIQTLKKELEAFKQREIELNAKIDGREQQLTELKAEKIAVEKSLKDADMATQAATQESERLAKEIEKAHGQVVDLRDAVRQSEIAQGEAEQAHRDEVAALATAHSEDMAALASSHRDELGKLENDNSAQAAKIEQLQERLTEEKARNAEMLNTLKSAVQKQKE
ncbi:MAG: hypothetical protein LC540_17515 [Candidatus Thiodiazotropha sp.]|nr:hypothetical protein [Candidatus Thiodiazotropha sp.]